MNELKNSLKIILNNLEESLICKSFNGLINFQNIWSCKVFCDEIQQYKFIEDYLSPYFESVSQSNIFVNDQADLLMYVSSDKNLYDEFLNIVSSVKGSQSIQVHYDQEVDSLIIDDMHIFVYKKWKHIVINNSGIVYVLLNGIYPNAKYIPMRILRDTTYHAMLGQGFLECHAASVQLNNKGILICGEGGAGKTTLAFSLVDKKNGEFLSNDKTFLNCEDNSYKIYGWPYSINIYMNTANIIESFSFLLNGELNHYQHEEWEQYNKGKRTISINELSEKTGISVKGESSLDFLVFPSRDKDILKGKIKKISKGEAMEKLKSSYRFNSFIDWIKLGLYIDKLNQVNNVEMEKKYVEFISNLLQHVPAYEIGAYDTQQEAMNLIKKLKEDN